MTDLPRESALGWPGDMPEFAPASDYSQGAIAARALAENVQLRAERSDLFRLARTDALTGLPNRLAVTETLDALAQNEPGAFAVMFADVDGLKEKNDTEGHDAGDALIIEVADVLRSNIRTRRTPEHPEPRPLDFEGHPARLAGDEFVLVFRGVRNQQQLTAVNNRIIDSLEAAGIAASTGMVIHEPGQTGEEVIKYADQAMYQNKRERKAAQREERRRERIAAMSPEDRAKAVRVRNLLASLSMDGAEFDDVFGE